MVYVWIIDVGCIQHMYCVIDNKRNVQESQVEKRNTKAWSHCLLQFREQETMKKKKTPTNFVHFVANVLNAHYWLFSHKQIRMAFRK